MSASRAVCANRQLVLNDLTRERSHVLDRARAGARQPEIGGMNAESFHQVQNFDLVCDRRIAHRGRLQTIAQSLVIQHHAPGGPQGFRMNRIPVVNELRGVHEYVSDDAAVCGVNRAAADLAFSSLGGMVKPNMEMRPVPATLTPLSS